jgi:alpha-glycerophosphate oxidase/glycerol-3-phosphate dehydrogenase
MHLRSNNIKKLENETFDVLILGGGINGAVSAASLAAKGVKVALIDKGDFAGLTSSNSSNLAWGGIKYLESLDFLLVNKLCQSRNRLMHSFPSTVQEIRFFTCIEKGFRFPPLLIFLGTILYWLMGRCQTSAPRLLSAKQLKAEETVVNTDNAAGGIEYSDCYLHDNDARFVFNFIRGCMNYGGIAANYVKSTGAHKEDGYWLTDAMDTISNRCFTIRSKVLINACGPYVDQLNNRIGQQTEHCHVFSKGIHLIVDRVTDSNRVLTFFATDGRLFFAIPMGPKTCIGTTDIQVEDAEVSVTEEERRFVLENINKLLDLAHPLGNDDIIAERCGVRPLAQVGKEGVVDWLKLSRQHVIEVNSTDNIISIFGGKLTDCINVGDEIAAHFRKLDVGVSFRESDMEWRWYGEPSAAEKAEFMHQAELMKLDAMTDETSSELLTTRLWRRYGVNALELLEMIREDQRNAELLIENAEYLRCEIELAAKREMITKMEDFLRRRSKIEQVVRKTDIIHASGLRDASRIFFAGEAETKLQEYIDSVQGV